jgi:hypothetical protein
MEAWHEPVYVRDRVQELIEQSVMMALSKLGAAVRGQDDFTNEREFRACVAMSRLAPFVMQELPRRETIWDKVHPDNTPEEAIRSMRRMGYPEDIIRDGCPIDPDTVPREEPEIEEAD